MRLSIGTSGFSYKEWKGSFYPKELGNDEMLAYYGQHLTAVEINNTFYRLPRASVLEGWAAQVPERFRFVLKASRKITHFQRLKDAGDLADYLVRTATTLGEHLGLIFFQLPGNFKKDLPRLETFLGQIPMGTPTAVEFRHESWFDDAVYALLRQHDCALCYVDSDEPPMAPLVSTAPFGYLRLRRDSYPPRALAKWAERLAEQSWDEVFVFFKHEGGDGPRFAQQLLEIGSTKSGAKR